MKRLVPEAPTVPVRDIFRRFWPFARPLRRWLFVALLLTATGPALEAATIWLFKVLIDQVLVPRDFGPFGWLAAAYLGMTLARGALSFADDLLSAWLGERFVLGLRVAFFSHLQRLSLDFFDRRQMGDRRIGANHVPPTALGLSHRAEGADFDQPARCAGDHPRLPRPQRRRTSDKRSRRNWRRCRRRFGLRGFLGGRPWKFLRDLSFRSGTPRSCCFGSRQSN